MFFQSKIRTEAIEANRQFGQIVYGKSGRIGDLPYMHGAKFKFSGYMTVSGLCMHDFCARASAPCKIFCFLLKFLLKNFYKYRVGSKKSESTGVQYCAHHACMANRG